jgi:hypothetical protein
MLKKICFLLLLPLGLFGQSTEPPKNRFALTVDPLAAIDIFSCPAYRFGVEMPVYKNFSLALEGGGYFEYAPLYKNVIGYMLKSELKRYAKNRNNMGSYFALSYFYKRQTYTVDDVLKRVNTPLYYTMDKKVHALTLKYGYTSNGRRVFYDAFCGLGVRYKNVDGIGLTPYEIQNRRGTGESEFALFRDLVGVHYLPNIDIGVKICYRLF